MPGESSELSIGRRYGHLNITKVDRRPYGPSGIVETVAFVKCDCGNERWMRLDGIKNGDSKACGCLSRTGLKRYYNIHGMSRTPVYKMWNGMKLRCINPNTMSWKDYGGRGIRICDRWMRFENFYVDMGDRPSDKHSIERIDVNGNYCPENCKWILLSDQLKNTRRTRRIIFNGVAMCLSELSTLTSINRSTLQYRIFFRGMSPEVAVAKPIR